MAPIREISHALTVRNLAFTMRDSSRSIFRWPPLQAFRAALALPSAVPGPVARSHGFQVRISAACCARRSGVQVVAMLCL